MKTQSHPNNKGSVLVGTLFLVAVLSAIAGGSIYYASNKRTTMSQAGKWQEALFAAEAGLHSALADCATRAASGLSPQSNVQVDLRVDANTTARYYMLGVTSNSGQTWVVRSISKVLLPGSQSVSMEGADASLRKLSISGAIPYASRTVQMVIRPIMTNDVAVSTAQTITIKNGTLTMDAFDSTRMDRSYAPTGTYIDDPNSTDPNDVLYGQPPIFGSPAQPVPGTYTQNYVNPVTGLVEPIYDATFATNGQLIAANDATIYGDAYTNGGIVSGATNVMGEVKDDYYRSMPTVTAPTWYPLPTHGVPVTVRNKTTYATSITGSVTLRGGTKDAPARYSVDAVQLSGGSDALIFDYGTFGSSGNVDTTKGYIELYVKGDFITRGQGTTTDGGSVIINKGVNVTLYIGDDMKLSGNGITNQSSAAPYLTIYGLNPSPTATSTDAKTQEFDFGGTSMFFGSVFAPGADITGNGNAIFVGNIVGKTATFGGSMNFFYDVALKGSGMIMGYKYEKWFEDTGPNRNNLTALLP